MRAFIIAVLVAGCLAFVPSTVSAGLYGDDKDIKTGDLNDQDYWWTKFDMMMLDLALKQKQPEGKIGYNLISTQSKLKDLSKKYPNHDGIKLWQKKVDEVNARIDPNANRSESFKPGCPWDEANFAQMWVNYNWAKQKAELGDRDGAMSLLQNVKQNAEILTKPDRMKDYPNDLREWVIATKADADKMYLDLKSKSEK
jgi:hypothetical protein